MTLIRTSLLAALLATSAIPALAAGSYDILVKGGTVLDGSGKPGVISDVGVKDGKIVFVGKAGKAKARTTINAAGLVVAPGFIDVHNHSATYIVEPGDYTNSAYLTQGVTTIVEGPDGALAPKEIRSLTAKLQQTGFGTNYAFYVGHNGIRQEVMGSEQRAPRPDELDRMKALVREGMEMGTVGLSTGLMYEPGMFSDTAEVIALAKEVTRYDGTYDSHTRNPVFAMVASESEAIEIGKAAGIPPKLGHLKAVGLVNKGKIDDVIALVEKERAAGVDVVSDQYPYDGAATEMLQDIIIPAEKPMAFEAVVAALKDPKQRARIKDLTENGINGGFSWVKAVGYGSMRIVDAPSNPEFVGKNIELFAKEREQAPFDLVVDLVLNAAKPIMITLGSIDEKDVQKLLVQPWNMISSDGAHMTPDGRGGFHHPRSTGSYTRILGHYVRDLGILTLPEAVRKMTALPADHLRLHDRGRISVGKAADIVVFNAATVRDRSTWTQPDAFSEGVIHVLVNGVPVIRDGAVTGEKPGVFVKRQSKTDVKVTEDKKS